MPDRRLVAHRPAGSVLRPPRPADSEGTRLEHAGHLTLAVNEISQTQSIAKGTIGNEQGLSL